MFIYSIEAVRWVTEKKRPFTIVADTSFIRLMKTGPGRAEIYIPSPVTVGRDVRKVFVGTRQRVAKMLQVSRHHVYFADNHSLRSKEYPGGLSFALDGWTSPNHIPFVAITVHLEQKGVPTSMILDIVKLAKRHTGVNLAQAVSDVIHEFCIEDKVSMKK